MSSFMAGKNGIDSNTLYKLEISQLLRYGGIEIDERVTLVESLKTKEQFWY